MNKTKTNNVFPNQSRLIDEQGRATTTLLNWAQRINSIVNNSINSGSSRNRPAFGSGVYIGMSYFDTNLNKPIYVKSISNNNIVWCDAMGNII